MNKIERPFKFGQMSSTGDFSRAMKEAGIDLPVSDKLELLGRPVKIGNKYSPNAMAIHPLEGFDGTIDGKPSDLIFRRYARYARGGTGLIWYEAVAVSEDGRCNPYEMWINKNTLAEIARLVKETKQHGEDACGHRIYSVVQLTHTGRISRDTQWNDIPITAFPNPLIDKYYPNLKIASDERIERLEQEVIDAALLCGEAGFDSVDIKICHNYLMRELLAGFTRPGKYGGSFENRTRFLFNVLDGIQKKAGDSLDISVRINAYDCIPYPYGWGMVKEDGVMKDDLTEPIKLIKMLVERNVKLINVSTHLPRFLPTDTGWVDWFAKKAVVNPYRGTAYLLNATRKIKEAVPDAICVATGLTWFEQFGGNVGAGGIEQGWFDIAGFGRQGFAYPGFANDILKNGRMDRNKCCVTCDKCFDLLGGHEFSGCVMRDREEYLPRYQHMMSLRKE
jgi:2,4-dienoyl-CoA reductase-like NADH-dependent reductase (Old Yellow Enzyme family)